MFMHPGALQARFFIEGAPTSAICVASAVALKRHCSAGYKYLVMLSFLVVFPIIMLLRAFALTAAYLSCSQEDDAGTPPICCTQDAQCLVFAQTAGYINFSSLHVVEESLGLGRTPSITLLYRSGKTRLRNRVLCSIVVFMTVLLCSSGIGSRGVRR